MNIPQIITESNRVFFVSVSITELNSVKEQLKDVLENRAPNAENKENAEFVLMKIDAKILALKYFTEGYLEQDYRALCEFLTPSMIQCFTRGWEKTKTLLESLKEVADIVSVIMKDAFKIMCSVRDSSGNCTTTQPEDLIFVRDEFLKKIEQAKALPDTKELFGQGVKMFDIKNDCVIKDLKEISDWADAQIVKIATEQTDYFFKTNVMMLSDEPGDKDFTFYPAMPDKSTTWAKTIILCSPFRDEVILFARAYEKENSVKFATFNANDFANKDNEFIDKIFEALKTKNIGAIFFGFAEYHGANEPYIMESILRFTNSGGTVFPVDSRGDSGVYKDFLAVAKKCGMSVMDVTNRYLTMPPYKNVIIEFESRGMITGADYDFLKKYMAFMGYVGMSKAVSLFSQGKRWRDDVLDISKAHESMVQTYIMHIPSQNQLIDADWIDLSITRNAGRSQTEFDYDSIRSANPNNIRKILNSNLNVFQKCGYVTRYCLLCGDDISIWKDLSAPEKSKRLTDATRLVCFILETDAEPEVKVIPEKEWEHKGAGGVCCDGGKLIIYREDCCDNYDWMVKAICHESYHALQSTAENGAWREWYWTELGVTKNRIPEWQYNSSHYKGVSSEAYKIEIIECDARAFERDCFEQSNSINYIDLE